MTDSAQPFAPKKFLEIMGRRMAYIDEGEGAPIVFAHGNPTSSYLWRNVMPACRGLGRLIACDMIGRGDSEKLPDSGPDRYTYAEQRSFLFALWEKLGVDTDVAFVLHDWGSLLGFDWTRLRLLRGGFALREPNFVSFRAEDVQVIANHAAWNGPATAMQETLQFRPHFGWVGAIEKIDAVARDRSPVAAAG